MSRKGPGSKAYVAYLMLERMIIWQELAPGSVVSEAELMTRTGLGRTPVREAVQRLAHARMVEVHRNRGLLIPPISIHQELKLLELRRVLEALAVRLAVERADPVQRSQIGELLAQLNTDDLALDGYVECVGKVHDLVAQMSGNEYLQDALAPLQGLSRRFWLAFVDDDVAEISTWADDVRHMLTGVLSGDGDAAVGASERLNLRLVEFARAAADKRPRNFSRYYADRPVVEAVPTAD